MSAIPEPVTCLKCNKSMKAIGHIWCYRCRYVSSQPAHLTPSSQQVYSVRQSENSEVDKFQIQQAVVDFYAAEMEAGRGIDYSKGMYIRTLAMENARNVQEKLKIQRFIDSDHDAGSSCEMREVIQSSSPLDHEGDFGDQIEGSLPPDQTYLRGMDRGISRESRCG